MYKLFSIEKAPVYIKLLISIFLFSLVSDFHDINSFSKLVVAILEFIILLELVRMLVDFVFSDDNRIKLRYMIDSTIVFFIRDLMLIVNDKFDTAKIAAILGVIGVLFIFRIISMKYSPGTMEINYKKPH